MFKKIVSIFRVYFLGLIGIFSMVCFVLSYHPEYNYYSVNQIPEIVVFSCFSMISVSSYFFIQWDVISYEYRTLREEYLRWIGKQKSLTVFFVSILLNSIIMVCQIVLIEIILRFSNFSISTASDISLFYIIFLNFFIFRTYVFAYKEKNYFHQAIYYTIISIVNLTVNYWAVYGIVNNFNWLNNLLLGFPNAVSVIIGYKSTPQFILSTFTGWVWFLCHKNITFKKTKKNDSDF